MGIENRKLAVLKLTSFENTIIFDTLPTKKPKQRSRIWHVTEAYAQTIPVFFLMTLVPPLPFYCD
tara:strand:+ start:2792 stop:2986 length:195 start_codon:yes stop_codon:yes gene_type:complete